MASADEVLELRLRHMATAVEHLNELASWGRGRFDAEWVVRSAAKDQLETLGESVAAIQEAFGLVGDDMPPPLCELAVPWAAVKGMRNFLTHRYYEIDWEVVWTTVTKDVPAIGSELRTVVP